MELESRTALPGLLVAGWLLIQATAPAAPQPLPCPRPREAAAVEGRSVAVVCRPGPGRERPLRGPVRLLFGLPIDPNRADALTLEALPGIGPVRAQAVVRSRARRPFERVAELARVPGIGPKTLEKIAPYLAVGGESGGSGAGPDHGGHGLRGQVDGAVTEALDRVRSDLDALLGG